MHIAITNMDAGYNTQGDLNFTDFDMDTHIVERHISATKKTLEQVCRRILTRNGKSDGWYKCFVYRGTWINQVKYCISFYYTRPFLMCASDIETEYLMEYESGTVGVVNHKKYPTPGATIVPYTNNRRQPHTRVASVEDDGYIVSDGTKLRLGEFIIFH